MRRVPIAVLSALMLIAACTPGATTPEIAAARCEERARAAQGPTGSVQLGVNSRTGGFAGASIAVSSDFLAGRNPLDVYEQCVYDLSGQAPIRPPRLR